MDTELREHLEHSFGDGPPLAPADLVARGHRALLRRRLARGASGLVVVGVVVAAVAVTTQQTPAEQTPVAPATSTATPTPPDGVFSFVPVTDGSLPESKPVDLRLPNQVLQRPGVHPLSVSMNPSTDHAFEIAMEYRYDGRVWWYHGYLDTDGTGEGEVLRPEPGIDFHEWANPSARTVR